MSLNRANFSLGNQSSQMGWSLSSIIDDAQKAVKTQVKQVENKISTQSKEILGDKLYSQASALVKKEGEKLTEAAKDYASGKMNEYLAKPENQKAIIDGGVDAMATKTKAYLWSLTESYKANGFLGLRLTHPVLFYSVVVVGGLTLAGIAFRVGRLVVGKKSSTVKMKSNPRTKKGVKSFRRKFNNPCTFPDFTLSDLKSMPTIASSQTDDLKFDDGKTRVWLSRLRRADGLPYNNQVTIEKFKNGSWSLVRSYRPKSSSMRANPRKEEKLGKAPKNIYICVSDEAGLEEYFGLLSEMPDYMRDNLLSEEEGWMATAYKGTDKQFREAKADARYQHSSHSAPKYLKKVDLGDYL